MCFSYNPFDGPNENPESELPLTAGEYIYIYGDMDEDGFFEGGFDGMRCDWHHEKTERHLTIFTAIRKQKIIRSKWAAA